MYALALSSICTSRVWDPAYAAGWSFYQECTPACISSNRQRQGWYSVSHCSFPDRSCTLDVQGICQVKRKSLIWYISVNAPSYWMKQFSLISDLKPETCMRPTFGFSQQESCWKPNICIHMRPTFLVGISSAFLNLYCMVRRQERGSYENARFGFCRTENSKIKEKQERVMHEAKQQMQALEALGTTSSPLA